MHESQDRPRNRSKRKRKKNGGKPTWLILAVSGILLVAAAAGGFFAFRTLQKPKDKSLADGVATSQSSTSGATESKASAGSKYIPRVSEEKLGEFLKNRNPSEVTEEQVYSIMGEPTRRDAPITGRKNGQVFTVYKAYWESPGSGVKSQIGFANGHVAGVILGLETSSSNAGNRK
jgi:cytoskeletal protein RodZ